MDNLTTEKVRSNMRLLGISPKYNELNMESFFNSKEKDEHFGIEIFRCLGMCIYAKFSLNY